MEKKHKDLVRKNFVNLNKELDFKNTKLPNVLYTLGLLTQNDCQTLQVMQTKRDMSSHFLLNILQCRGPDAFDKFMRGLMMTPGQEHIAKMLDPDLATTIERDLASSEPPVKLDGKKNVLRNRHLYLIENIHMKNTGLMDYLEQEGLLSDHEREKLEALVLNDKMVSEFLLNMLPYRGPDHLIKFVKVLNSTEDDQLMAVAKTLQNDMEPPVDEVDAGTRLESIVSKLKTAGISAFSSLTAVTKEFAEKAMKKDAYPMRKNKRGRAVIINNVYFVRDNARVGADVDLDDLKKLFENLYFDVVPHENLGSDDINRVVEDECKPGVHDNYDAFVMFILTHGTNGYVKGMDSTPVRIDDIVKKIARCESLKGKPKIFFIQACRVVKGSTRAAGTGASDASDANPIDNGMKEVTEWSPMQDAGSSTEKISGFKDIYVAYSTVPGFYSFRSEDTGSWFVRFLVYVCSTCAHVDDLETMMKMVNRLLEIRPEAEKNEQIGQTVATGLLRKIYFFPKYSV